ncbi:hypothetical protein [Halomarina pelagica]|uniref:hypothetical protein n=1 Tax=Halomarina pelagica TaxID=2961599 RepID=UPI0020C50545|nr:hypothetical protein [Halomarina sp. BND7]
MVREVSFTATDELLEWLESEAQRRATTLPATVQGLLAERYREERPRDEGRTDGTSQYDEEALSALTEELERAGGERPPLERHPDVWHVESRGDGNEYAVRLPDGKYAYYRRREFAARRVVREYEGGDAADPSFDLEANN